MLYTLWLPLLAIELILLLLLFNSKTKTSLQSFFSHPLVLKTAFPLLRIGIAGMFLAACYPKLMSPYGFAELVAQYQLLPEWSVNFFSLWLPVFELIVALGLIFTKWSREFSGMIVFMMLLFIIALGQALARDLGITCGCFDIEGAQDKTGAWISLVRDVVLLVPLIWLFQKGPNKFLWNFRD